MLSFEKEKNISVSYAYALVLFWGHPPPLDKISSGQRKKENYPLLFQIEILLGRLVAKDASSVPPRRSLGAVRADTNLVSLNLL